MRNKPKVSTAEKPTAKEALALVDALQRSDEKIKFIRSPHEGEIGIEMLRVAANGPIRLSVIGCSSTALCRCRVMSSATTVEEARDADRRAKLLIYLTVQGSLLDAYSQSRPARNE
jgi:hypothetical protein